MFTLEANIVGSKFESPLDSGYAELFKNDHFLYQLSDIKKINPYSHELNQLLDQIEQYRKGQKTNFSDWDIEWAYNVLYFFTSIQSNLADYFPIIQHKADMITIGIDIFIALRKQEYEAKNQQEIQNLLAKKKKDQENLEKAYPDKKNLSSTEVSFIKMKISEIDKAIDIQISNITGMKANAIINNQIKSDPYINELIRKQAIIDIVKVYLEKLFKVCQEQVNTHKKIIDNLQFLYNQSSIGNTKKNFNFK